MLSCKRQVTCAAYQSYFLLDDEAQTHFFNPFGDDSIPKNSQIVNKKAGNGITTGVNPKTYKKYHYFVPMKDVITVQDTVAFNDEAEVLENPEIESDPDGISTSATKNSPVPSDTSNSFSGEEELFFDDEPALEENFDEYAPDEFIED